MTKKKLVILTGAGISAESGIQTFRGSDGLWEGHDIMEVASPEGFEKDPELVLNFYNQRRRQLKTVEPNAAHIGLKALEEDFDVTIITQNVDDLHERGGSTNILHLHGVLTKARSTFDPELILDIGYDDIKMGDMCSKNSQLRPHIVWFGENVPAIFEAVPICKRADIFAVIGTSMIVYPAAALIDYVPVRSPKFIIDPNIPDLDYNITCIPEKATVGINVLKEKLKDLK